ncbi:hypothetical protein PFBG_00078 [Plasmodium falciparum 7G8]|uniref:Uncharacterized protein n=2 Tax=Plasmodium falciparum TaxID=5833 RepID=A0A024WFC4_PLAFA|nr:hypothetical protein PFTANZ_00086 [Plasmodium falciparum Tanzania (2000708)]EUR82516.1 hypothetical protein PFBG_00078 [Plasmodium falciparum 7G8]
MEIIKKRNYCNDILLYKFIKKINVCSSSFLQHNINKVLKVLFNKKKIYCTNRYVNIFIS